MHVAARTCKHELPLVQHQSALGALCGLGHTLLQSASALLHPQSVGTWLRVLTEVKNQGWSA